MKGEFKAWADTKIKERNELLAEKQDLNLHLDAEIAAAFNKSQNISSKYTNTELLFTPNNFVHLMLLASNGVAVNLLKVGSKRRRTQA